VSPPVELIVTTAEPGTMTVRAVAPTDLTEPHVAFTPEELAAIERAVLGSGATSFSPDQLEITVGVGPLCSFDPGEPTEGLDQLEDPPSWWVRLPKGHAVDGGIVEGLWGGNCDIGADGDVALTPPFESPIAHPVSREIYGERGRSDCGLTRCYVTFWSRWTHPLNAEAGVSGGKVLDRTVIQLPADWPTPPRPSVHILEPGPYRQNQQVTVEVRNPRVGPTVRIAWCLGGDVPCGYLGGIAQDDGSFRATMTLTPSAVGCGERRCYFQVNSGDKGAAPPAILIVPIEG
jgi:hypothetical protein